jgi:hypothetical protein
MLIYREAEYSRSKKYGTLQHKHKTTVFSTRKAPKILIVFEENVVTTFRNKTV